jgi:sigma-54 specific flagellar transcriptional regulator A
MYEHVCTQAHMAPFLQIMRPFHYVERGAPHPHAHTSTRESAYAMTTDHDITGLQAWRDEFAPDFIGEHPSMLDVLSALRRICATHCDVLVTGASGTGKELVARSIHRASSRRNKPFVALNCAAIPKELMESEIFGHAKGAFTGASERRAGKFELAHGGTLFLDEVGEMELSLQSKLLRVLQERELTPVGDAALIKVDVRIVAATNQDLELLCKERLFREDLYYRLNVVPVNLPTLAQRRSDITLLMSAFLHQANQRHHRALKGFDATAAAAMVQYDWPGNVRELHNAIERICVLKPQEGPITWHDLPAKIASNVSPTRAGQPHTPERAGHGMTLPLAGLEINETLATMETRLTLDALRRSKGNKARAAELLGLKRTTLVERLKKLNLNRASEP